MTLLGTYPHTAWRVGAPREREGDILAQGFCWYPLLSHFTDEEVEAQSVGVPCLRRCMGLEPDPRWDRLCPELFPVGQDALERCGLPRRFQGTQSPTTQPPVSCHILRALCSRSASLAGKTGSGLLSGTLGSP